VYTGMRKECIQVCLLHSSRVGHNSIYAPYMTKHLVISLPKLPYIYTVYIVYIYYIYDSGKP